MTLHQGRLFSITIPMSKCRNAKSNHHRRHHVIVVPPLRVDSYFDGRFSPPTSILTSYAALLPPTHSPTRSVVAPASPTKAQLCTATAHRPANSKVDLCINQTDNAGTIAVQPNRLHQVTPSESTWQNHHGSAAARSSRRGEASRVVFLRSRYRQLSLWTRSSDEGMLGDDRRS